MPEYNFAQLHLLIHALEMLDTSEYDEGYRETHTNLLARFRKDMKNHNYKKQSDYLNRQIGKKTRGGKNKKKQEALTK